MTDEAPPHRLRWPRVFARLGGYTLLAVVLYALSVGPAAYLFNERSAGIISMASRIYDPVIRLANATGKKQVLVQYCGWWMVLPGGAVERCMARRAAGGNPPLREFLEPWTYVPSSGP